jgi:hypothetical protein
MNIFQDKTKSIPKGSENIIRVSMTQDDLVARKETMPKAETSRASIEHVPNRGGEGGGQ